ncbi:MAG TPA: helix-turn-helix domain-containing protein [Candidatus Saccharimonadales bacterium]|nr:helix-turn-helix domain-containing protein [Candidatus Saccharimonadales bacterium]
MKRASNRSRCPINFTTEIFGDTWSFLILRGILTYGAKTYSDFLKSEERIGTSVLADRLVHLEKAGIILKSIDKEDGRKVAYTLTEAGLGTIPIIYEMALWGTMTSENPKMPPAWFEAIQFDRTTVLKAWREAIMSDSAFFVGPNSVVRQLGLNT